MAEYIDRKALGIGKCNPDVFEDKGYARGWNSAIKIIEEAPTVDVEPVKHSFWKNNNLYFPNLGECDVCGYEHYNPDELKYCPNCGAKMDGESND